MSAPNYTIVSKFGFYRLWTTILVFLSFMVVDFIWHGLISPKGPYTQDLVDKLIWTAILAFTFTVIYNHASTWHATEEREKGLTGKKIWNSILFSLFISVMFIAVIALSGYLITVTFMYLLDAFHGIPEDPIDDVALTTEIIVGGLVLEACGKGETEERRNG